MKKRSEARQTTREGKEHEAVKSALTLRGDLSAGLDCVDLDG